jgi:hypothetical protein
MTFNMMSVWLRTWFWLHAKQHLVLARRLEVLGLRIKVSGHQIF